MSSTSKMAAFVTTTLPENISTTFGLSWELLQQFTNVPTALRIITRVQKPHIHQRGMHATNLSVLSSVTPSCPALFFASSFCTFYERWWSRNCVLISTSSPLTFKWCVSMSLNGRWVLYRTGSLPSTVSLLRPARYRPDGRTLKRVPCWIS